LTEKSGFGRVPALLRQGDDGAVRLVTLRVADVIAKILEFS
jgi:hypothetical protein